MDNTQLKREINDYIRGLTDAVEHDRKEQRHRERRSLNKHDDGPAPGSDTSCKTYPLARTETQ